MGPREGTVPSASEQSLVRVKKAVLSFGHHDSGHLSPPHDDRWRQLMAWAQRERVIALASHAFRDQPGLTTAQRDELDHLSHRASMVSLHVDATAIRVGRQLSEAGVDFRVLKGFGTARLLYPDPSWRQYADIDMLVRRTDFARAIEALAPNLVGAPEAQPGPARRDIVKEYPLPDDRGVEIDLHLAVQGSLFTSTLDNEVLFSAGQPIPGSEWMTALSPIGLFVHSVLHVSSVNWRMSSIPDVLRLASSSSPQDDEFRALVRTRNHRALFAWALDRVIEWVELPDEWKAFSDQHRPAGRQASLYRWVHGSEERTRMVNMLLGPRRLKRAAETLWPSKEFLDEWGIDHRGNLRRLFRDAVTAAGGRHRN